MIQDIFINEYKWNVRILINISDLNFIKQELVKIQCPDNLIEEALDNFKDRLYNKGLTYSNYTNKQSLIIIGRASSNHLILNTLIHELFHFTCLFSYLNNIKIEEEKAIFIGNFSMLIYDIINKEIFKN